MEKETDAYLVVIFPPVFKKLFELILSSLKKKQEKTIFLVLCNQLVLQVIFQINLT